MTSRICDHCTIMCIWGESYVVVLFLKTVPLSQFSETCMRATDKRLCTFRLLFLFIVQFCISTLPLPSPSLHLSEQHCKMSGMRMRNVSSESEKKRLLNAIKAAEMKTGTKASRSPALDGGIKPYTPDRAKVREGGQLCDTSSGHVVPERVVVRRSDGGMKVDILTEPWRGAPRVLIGRGMRTQVPALLDNGELIIVEEVPGWRLRHKEYVKIKRPGQEACEGYVQKVHLDAMSLASHPSDWEQPKPLPDLLPNCHFRRKKIITDTRVPPRCNVKWQWAGKDLHCPLRLTDARDLPDGRIVATPQTYEDRRPAAEMLSGFHPLAAPTSVSVLPR